MIYPRTFDLAHWINEREAMRLRRESGMLPPWTADPIMETVRYCNVHREDDKVTRYIRTSSVYSGVSVPVWVVVLTRMVNRIETLEAIAECVRPGDLERVKNLLKIRREHGPIWGNAYTISTCGKAMDKVDYVVDHVVQAVKDEEEKYERVGRSVDAGDGSYISHLETLEAAHAWLMCIDGLGSFLAGQVIADLKNTPQRPLATASDWFTWSAPGPGSLRGLTAFWGTPITPSTYQARLSAAIALVTPLIGSHVAPIHAQDMQNCFCELSKYLRVKEGGHARNRYITRIP